MRIADDDPLERPLTGGRTTLGVVRIGKTVRRPASANSGLVRRLLVFLARAGFEGAPRSLGTDTAGRDVFSFIEGDVPTDLSFHDDRVLAEAARLIRRYHDLTRDFIAALGPEPTIEEVLSHNDLSPWNFVFHDGVPVAIIDFDAAELGSRSHDLGYAAWLWLDLGCETIEAVEQARRLALFLAAYGVASSESPAVVDSIIARQAIAIARGLEIGNTDMAAWAEASQAWMLKHAAVLTGGHTACRRSRRAMPSSPPCRRRPIPTSSWRQGDVRFPSAM